MAAVTLRALKEMFQPGGSNDTGSETGVAARKPARPAPVVDETLRAGAKLAQARQMLGLTLDEIAERTKVRRDYLEAIEAMNVKFLPGRAYTVPYVKSYAQLVGLDPQALIGQFLRESALAREDAQPQLRNPESKPRRERPWLMALLVAFAAAGFLGWQAVKDRGAETRTAAETATTLRRRPLMRRLLPSSVIQVVRQPERIRQELHEGPERLEALRHLLRKIRRQNGFRIDLLHREEALLLQVLDEC